MKSLAMGLSLLVCGQAFAADMTCVLEKKIATSEGFDAVSKEVVVVPADQKVEGVFRITKAELAKFEWIRRYENHVYAAQIASSQEKMLKQTIKYLQSNDLDQTVKIEYILDNNRNIDAKIYMNTVTSVESSSECFRGTRCYTGFNTANSEFGGLDVSTGTGTALTSAFSTPAPRLSSTLRSVDIDLQMRIKCN